MTLQIWTRKSGVDVPVITTEVRVTEVDLEKALRSFLFRSRVKFLILCSAILLCGVDVAIDWHSPYGLSGLMLVGLLVAIFLFSYVQRKKRNKALFRALGNRPVRYTLNSEKVVCDAYTGTFSFSWSQLEELWIGKSVALLFYSRGAYLTLPVNQLQSEFVTFLSDQLQNAGKRVVVTA